MVDFGTAEVFASTYPLTKASRLYTIAIVLAKTWLDHSINENVQNEQTARKNIHSTIPVLN